MSQDGNGNQSISYFDRTVGKLDRLPDVVQTKATTLVVVGPLGFGTHTYVVQTIRQREEGDYIFLQDVADGKAVQIVIPPEVAQCIARQRDQLTFKSRSKAGKQRAQDMKDKGIQPGFMRKK